MRRCRLAPTRRATADRGLRRAARGYSVAIEELTPVLLGHKGKPLPVYGSVGLLSLLPVAPHHFPELMTPLLDAWPDVL